MDLYTITAITGIRCAQRNLWHYIVVRCVIIRMIFTYILAVVVYKEETYLIASLINIYTFLFHILSLIVTLKKVESQLVEIRATLLVPAFASA